MDPDGVIESNWDQVVTSFDEMDLKEELLRGIYAYGFEKPSAIQQRAILPCIKGKLKLFIDLHIFQIARSLFLFNYANLLLVNLKIVS